MEKRFVIKEVWTNDYHTITIEELRHRLDTNRDFIPVIDAVDDDGTIYLTDMGE